MKSRSTLVKMVSLAALAFALCVGLAACTGSNAQSATYKDGTYTGKSSVFDNNIDGDGYCEVAITVEGGKIADAKLSAYEVDGTLKDKDYGKDGPYYAVAQKAVSAGDEYVSVLLQTGDVTAVDTVSGATMLHDQFVEAVDDALSQAKA